MTDQEQQQQLTKLIFDAVSLSEQLRSCGEEENWEKFEKLELQRRKTLEQISSLEIPENLEGFIRENIKKIKAIDKELLLITEKLKTEASQELIKLNRGNKATKSYQGYE